MSLVDFVPANAAEWFRWKSSYGFLNSSLAVNHTAGKRKEWRELTESLREHSFGIPAICTLVLLRVPASFQSEKGTSGAHARS